MEHKQYRAAVVGLGFIGAGDPVSAEALGQPVAGLKGSVHADVLANHPRTVLVAGSTRDDGRRSRFSARFPAAQTYSDYRRMIQQARPDIVSIATNTPHHADITVECAESGVACVFCEKPLATRLVDADRMIDACRAAGTLLVVNHNRRWNPLYGAARQALAEGVAGDLSCLSVRWPTGRLGNVGTHVFDAVHLMLGSHAVAVGGALDTTGTPDCRGPHYADPGGWGVVTYANGLHALVEANEAMPPEAGIDIRFVGSAGELRVGDQGCALHPWDSQAQTIARPREGHVTLMEAVDEIVACLDGGPEPLSSGEEARAALEIIVGFHASNARHSQTVALPLASDERAREVRIG